MSNELHAHDSTGKTLYAVLLSSVGTVRNGSAFVAINPANWTDYAIPLTEAAAGIYLGDMPTVAAGMYSYVVYEQAGASPAITDALRGLGSIAWDGTAEVFQSGDAYAVVSNAGYGNSALATAIGAVPTAAWEHTPRTLTTTAAETTAAVIGSALVITRATTYSATVRNLTISAGWTKIYFTIKSQKKLADRLAILQVVVSNPADTATDGVLYVESESATASQRTQARLTVDQSAGTVKIDIDDNLSYVLSEQTKAYYDIKEFVGSTSESHVRTESTVMIQTSVTQTV